MKKLLFIFIFLQLNTTLAQMINQEKIKEVQRITDFNETEGSVFISSKSESASAVLIIHGMNLRPSRMNSFAEFYYNKGYHVLRLTLMGHAGDFEALKKVRAEDWVNDVAEAYSYLSNKHPNSPIDLVAYSLGAVAALTAEQNQLATFNQLALFAPAFEMTRLARSVELLFGFENMIVPSRLSPKYLPEYSANKEGVPVRAFKALFELQKTFKQKANTDFLAKKRGYVFLAEKDEVIDWKKSASFFKNASSLDVQFIEKKNSKLKPVLHHMMIDEASLGETWLEILKKIST